MGLIENVKAWSFRLFAEKWLKRVIRLAISSIIARVPADSGISINPDAAFLASWGAVEAGASKLKVKLAGTKWEKLSKWLL